MPESHASLDSPTPTRTTTHQRVTSPRVGMVPPPPRTKVRPPPDTAVLRVVTWLDPIADPHGVHPCSRYVELYWLPIIGPLSIG
jgi:hypothetical protein